MSSEATTQVAADGDSNASPVPVSPNSPQPIEPLLEKGPEAAAVPSKPTDAPTSSLPCTTPVEPPTKDDYRVVPMIEPEGVPAPFDPSVDVASPDVDYEATGQGFVSREAIARSLSTLGRIASPARSPSRQVKEGIDGSRSRGNSAIVIQTSGRSDAAIELGEMKLGKQEVTTVRKETKESVNEVRLTIGDESKGMPLGSLDDIWRLSNEEVAKRFSSSHIAVDAIMNSQGLTAAEASTLLQQNGRNELKPPKEVPEIMKYLHHYTDPFMLLLIGAGILSAVIAYPIDTSQVVNLYLGIILFGVVILSCTFAYIQEGKASSVMSSFKNMLPAQARVIRDGREQQIPAAEIVVGDLLRVSGGDVVPADIRLIWTQDCKVETSSLTGESLPITCTLKSNAEKIEQATNVCFNSSKCLEGESIGVVFATGDATLIGKIAGLAGQTKGEATTLQKEINIFVRRLTLMAVIMGLIFWFVALAKGKKVLDSFINTFIFVVLANVPEGLPSTVVSCLTITAKRLSQLNVFVKQLQSVETLGSITVIASDKTGTLTQNIMAVANMWFDGQSNTADSIMQHYPPHRSQPKAAVGLNQSGKEDSYHIGATLEQLELIAVICSKTKFEDERQLTLQQAKQMEQFEALKSIDPNMSLKSAKTEFPTLYGKLDSNLTLNSGRLKIFASLGEVMLDDSTRKVIGDASETALFNFVRQRQSIELLRYHHPKVYDIPFNSRNKYAITITKPVGLLNESPEKRTLLMKGAPEVIVSRCSHFLRRGEILPIDDRFKKEFQTAYESFGSKGQRVLGFAMLDLPEEKYGSKFDSQYAANSDAIPTNGLVFAGLISLVDPPKLSVPQAVLDCHSAGVKVIMVTGDHPLTAAAIARQVNIFQAGRFTREELAVLNGTSVDEVPEEDVDCIVVKGPDLDHYTEADWLRTLSKPNIVFARTTPVQKLVIVEHLQAMGHIVAATGDGVNDSPALKKADIGVAMGLNGSDVARDAAAVILMDDNFASIVVGIREGRTIFDNLAKTIAYTLTHMNPEVMTVLMAVLFGFPSALSPILLLTIDLFTETPPAISLAYEPSEGDVMNRPPRNSKTDRLVTMQIMMYSLLQAGAIEVANAFFAFFMVFRYYGMSSTSLFNTPYFQGQDNNYMPGAQADPTKVLLSTCENLSNASGPYTIGNVCYNDDEQNEILKQAQTAFYAMVVLCQVSNIWYCKTRNRSLLEHGIFRNELTLYGVIMEICIMLLVIFVPSSNTIFSSSPFPGRFWPICICSPVVLGIWNEGRKWYVRKNPDSFVARYIHW